MTTKAESLSGIDGITKSRKVGNNTFEYECDDERRIRLHHTDIVTYKANGNIVLNTGGWQTVTTKDRINKEGFCIWQEKRVWYLSHGGETYIYQDGMTLKPDGSVIGAGKLPDKALIKNIKQYAKDFASSLPVDLPNGGDCWYCLMFDKEKPPQEVSQQHLLDHIDEKYYVPALLWNVLQSKGAGKAWYWGAFKDPNSIDSTAFVQNNNSHIQKWIYDYMYKALVR